MPGYYLAVRHDVTLSVPGCLMHSPTTYTQIKVMLGRYLLVIHVTHQGSHIVIIST